MTKLYKCTSCNKMKQPSEFPSRKDRPKGISSICKCCKKVVDKTRYDLKREEILAQKRIYMQNNRNKINESQNTRRLLNNEMYKERDRAYYQSNLEHHRSRKLNNTAKRRSKKLDAVAPWMTPTEEAKIRSLYKMSRKISESTGVEHHVDHIIPLVSDVVCGLHTIHNLRIVTKLDNLRKGNKVIEDIV